MKVDLGTSKEQLSERVEGLPTQKVLGLQPRSGPAARLRYLTVQDMIWINTQVTGQVQRFHFDTLEEVTYSQYGYGTSCDLLGQAARLLVGMIRYKPFADGNLRTAFIAVLTFLAINGYQVHLLAEEAGEWLRQVRECRLQPEEALQQVMRVDASHREREVHEVALELIHRYAQLVILHSTPPMTHS